MSVKAPDPAVVSPKLSLVFLGGRAGRELLALRYRFFGSTSCSAEADVEKYPTK